VGRLGGAVSTQDARTGQAMPVVGAAAPALALRPEMPAGMSRQR